MFAVLASCDDDDTKNIPDVSVSIEYSGAAMEDGVLYVTEGQPLNIDALVVTPAPGTGKAMLGNTVYYVDGYPVYATGVAPFSVEISTEGLQPGNHTLSVHSQIFQVDKSMGWGIFRYNFEVVAAEDMPSDPGSGTDTPALNVADTDISE